MFLSESIEGENLLVEELALGQAKVVPKDADAIIFAAPEKALLAAENKAILAYLNAGGRAILLHEPKKTGDVANVAKEFGAEIGNNLVIDPAPLSGQAVQPVVMHYAGHPITEKFDQGTMFSVVASVQASAETEEGTTVVELAKTRADSWGESDVDSVFGGDGAVSFGPDDLKGPVPIATAIEKKTTKDGAEEVVTRIVVIGDADFVTNGYLRQFFNRDFFLNSLNWVIGYDDTIALRPRSLRESTVKISPEQFQLMFLLTALIFPEMLLLLGLAVWWTRGAQTQKAPRKS
jgi:ABC-type uncharacterized transport system involved in gliding motility auxiliary subunit